VINCQVLRVTEIVLNSDETIASDGIGAGDTERWAIQPLNNRVLVKPKEPGIATDLIIVTNRRSYHFSLRTRTPYMPQVAFYYPTKSGTPRPRDSAHCAKRRARPPLRLRTNPSTSLTRSPAPTWRGSRCSPLTTASTPTCSFPTTS
jgi:type IV secretory pathway VirB9-like protein